MIFELNCTGSLKNRQAISNFNKAESLIHEIQRKNAEVIRTKSHNTDEASW